MSRTSGKKRVFVDGRLLHEMTVLLASGNNLGGGGGGGGVLDFCTFRVEGMCNRRVYGGSIPKVRFQAANLVQA